MATVGEVSRELREEIPLFKNSHSCLACILTNFLNDYQELIIVYFLI